MGIETKSITLRLNGNCPIMFDRFYGQEKDTRPPEQKFYLSSGNKIVLPTENIYSFMFGENPAGAAKTEGKKSKEYIRMGYSHILVDPVDNVPFQRNGQDIVFKEWEGNEDLYYVSEFSPRTKMSGSPNSIKQNLKKRPVLLTPWSVTFTFTVIKNPLITVEKIFNWFSEGGILIGLGTYRPRFGRFTTEIV